MSSFNLDEENRELILGFVEEGREMLDEVEPHLIEMEVATDHSGEIDSEVVNTVFRLFHSFKGGAGFLALNNIQRVAHVAETLLDRYRKRLAYPTCDHIDILNKACDFLRIVVERVEVTYRDNEFSKDADAIIDELQGVIDEVMSSQDVAERPVVAEAETQQVNSCGAEDKMPEIVIDLESMEEPEDDDMPNPDELSDNLDGILTEELVKQFIGDSYELLETVEQSLLQLEEQPEEQPDNEEAVSQAFRSIHSFKGNSGFLGQVDLEKISHATESILDKIRDKVIVGDGDLFSLLLEILDFIRIGLKQLETTGKATIPGLMGLISLLKEAEARLATGAKQDTEPSSQTEIPEVKPPAVALTPPVKQTETPTPAREKTVAEIANERRVAPIGRRASDQFTLGSSDGRTISEDRRTSNRRQSVRVDVEKLDYLLNLVGELVIAEAMVAQNPDLKELDIPLDNFEKSVRQLGKITRDLQETSNSIRMIPLSATFKKMIRLVRDVSHKSGKKVNFKIVGEETEVDKTVIEKITDPLIHIIRNSIDHGIQSPEEREKIGMSESGNVVLEAKYVGGEVWIQVSDDGAGLNRKVILEKARSKGIIDGDVSNLSDEEVWQIIFQPGFSTAAKVTDVSGRGVGMDVVRRNIENIRGRVDVKSSASNGTTVILRIPLTLAIIEGMIIRVGKSLYTIPIGDIRESFQSVNRTITKTMDGQEIVKLRDELLPVVRLTDFLNIESDCQILDEGILIVVENSGRRICLFIDDVIGQQQVVIKGIPTYIGALPGVSGCTILGDGGICLILDIGGLINSVEKQESD